MSDPQPLRRILVVDDDRFIRAAVEKALALGGGYTTRLCASGAEAVAHVAEFEPDLILLDVVMPGLDGPATLRALRAVPSAAATPVAFLTATTDPAATDALRALGAIAVLEKPFDPAHLARRLATAWAEAHERETDGDGQLAAELRALRAEYAATLPEEAARIRQEALRAFGPMGSREAWVAVRNAVHSLSGSGASFGFEAVTAAASWLEVELDRLIRANRSAQPAERERIMELVGDLEWSAQEAAQEAAERPAADLGGDGAALGASAEPGRPRLLVVDDVEAVRQRYALVLEAAGFAVDVAGTGGEALALAQERPYDLILLDLCMPGMDGFEAQRELREAPATHETPIVFMTASPSVDLTQVQRALALGVSGFIPKSLSASQLAQEVRSLLPAAGLVWRPAPSDVA